MSTQAAPKIELEKGIEKLTSFPIDGKCPAASYLVLLLEVQHRAASAETLWGIGDTQGTIPGIL